MLRHELLSPLGDIYTTIGLRSLPPEQIVDQFGDATSTQFQAARSQEVINPLIITARNEATDLPATLLAAALTGNTLPIVVNNNSIDDTVEIAQAMGAIVRSSSEGGKMGGTQTGIAFAQELGADTMFFIDADTLVLPHWTTIMRRKLDNIDTGSGTAVYGNGILWYGESRRTDVVLSAGKAILYAAYTARDPRHKMARGYNYALRPDNEGRIVEEINKIDPNTRLATEDGQMKEAILRAGGRIVCSLHVGASAITRNDRVASLSQRFTPSYKKARSARYQAEYGPAVV